MPVKSARPRSVVILQVLLAMVFLAMIGGSAGYLLGRQRQHRLAAARSSTPGTPGTPDARDDSPTPAAPSASPSADPKRCLAYTEQRAGVSPLIEVLYLRTIRGSSVWICQDQAGRLYYQGYTGAPGGAPTDGQDALFSDDVHREGADGYAATYTDSKNEITEYHVTPARLVIKFKNFASPQPDQTEKAVPR
jgi:hypothetical protein